MHTLFNAHTHTHTNAQARPATTTSVSGKRNHLREGPSHHQISRVPPLPLFDKGGGSSPSLEPHSSPVHLVTRSLSARNLHHHTAVAVGGGGGGTPGTSSTGGLRAFSSVSLPSSSLKQSSPGAQQVNTANKSVQGSSERRRHSTRTSEKRKVRMEERVATLHKFM